MDRIYELTTLILGVGSMVMGFTLLIFSTAKKYEHSYNKTSLVLLSIAMLILGVINLAEYVVGVVPKQESNALALVILAASIELFLLQHALISLLNAKFVTRKRISIDLGLIAIFTVPAVCISPADHKGLFDILFTVGVVFYVVKLLVSVYVYKKNLDELVSQITNFHSDIRAVKVQWLSNIFYVVIVVGAVSVLVPLTNYTVLVVYNSFLFFAYLYIYVAIIRNIDVFKNSVELLQQVKELGRGGFVKSGIAINASQQTNFMAEHSRVFEKLMAQRFYATPGITADEVSSLLNTNRTLLSAYLNRELNMRYYEWISSMRIEDSKRLILENPDMSMIEIAFKVGIEDKSNFGRTFKRITGVSPLEYRKLHLPDVSCF